MTLKWRHAPEMGKRFVGLGPALCVLVTLLGCSGTVDVRTTRFADDGGPPPQKPCAGSDAGGATVTDGSVSACTWERCPGAVALSIGHENCVLMGDATVRCASASGSDLVDQGLTEVQAVVSGAIHHCALRTDGTIWCWGDNKWGALGDPALPRETVRPSPEKVIGIENAIRVDTQDTFLQRDTTCALERGGEVKCWGGEWPLVPTSVPALAGSRDIAVADESVCGVQDSSTVRCVYPDGSVTTFLLNARVVDLVATAYTLCAQTGSLDVSCMGVDGKPAPSLESELAGARFLTTGLGQVCGLLGDGTLGCSEGSEGSTFHDRCEGSDVIDVRATQFWLCALHADGAIRCANSG